MIVIPPDPWAEDDEPDVGPSAGTSSGPPAGHPERVPEASPPTEAEREFWTHLEGLDWPR